MTTIDYNRERRVVRGPFLFFDGSFKVEFLEAEPELNATTLIRATYVANHPLLKKALQFPQTPPVHLHFHQIETFKIVQGAIGVHMGYEQKEVILTPENTPFDIPPMVPHQPFPHAELSGKGEDTVALMFAHPHQKDSPLDDLFFEHLFKYLDECYSEKKSIDILQICLSQHASGTAMVMFPKLSFLGPLRWWVPWLWQGSIAWVARRLGYSPLIGKYMKEE